MVDDKSAGSGAGGADVLFSGGLAGAGAGRSASSSLGDRLRQGYSALSFNQRVMMGLAVVVLAAVAIFSVVSLSSNEKYRTLYTGLSDQDGASIIAALDQLSIPYQLAAGGTAIMVPETSVYETRLKLAGQGLPKSADAGFEILDNQKFGTSQFVEQVNYVRAMEGELAKSIASIEQVKSARVHLAIPKQTAFAREQENPSASVVVALYPGRLLDTTQTAAIGRLVSSSVPRLKLQDVSIVDTEGNILAPVQRDPEGLDGAQLKYVRDLERVLVQRVVAILEPVAGKEGVRAQVTAELDFDQRETTSESFGRNAAPEGQSIRSRQEIEAQGSRRAPGGVPGALTNQAPVPPEAPIVEEINAEGRAASMELQAPGDVDVNAQERDEPGFRRESTINFEVDRVIESLKQSKGKIRRISAAVVLDQKTTAAVQGASAAKVPYTEDELEKITALVRDAIGFTAERGDRVSVVNIPFSVEPPAQEDPPMITPDLLRDLLTYFAIAAAVLFAYFAIIKPLLYGVNVEEKNRLEAELAATRARIAESQQRANEELERLRKANEAKAAEVPPQPSEAELRAQAEAEEKERLKELMTKVQSMATDRPDELVRLLQAWLSSDDQATKKSG